MESREKVIEKALKLKNLMSSPVEAEADLAFKKLQIILAKNNLTMSDLEKDAFGNVILIADSSVWVRNIINSVSRLYFCRMFFRKEENSSKTRYTIVGNPENAEVIKEICTHIIYFTKYSVKKINLNKNSFCIGVSYNIANRCNKLIEMAKRGDLSDETGTFMVPANMYDSILGKIDDFLNEKYTLKNTKTRNSTVDGTAYRAGLAFGERFELQKSIK